MSDLAVSVADSQAVGGCNFCPARPTQVYLVRSGMGLEVRLCDNCLGQVCGFRSRANAAERVRRGALR